MKNKFLKITIITVLLIFVYATIANALSFTATITPSSTTVAESTEFTVQIKVSNLDVGPNGLNGLTGYFKYDNSVFETISESSIEGMNSWDAEFNAENGKITLTKTTFVKTEEVVLQVTLKTKAGVSGKSGTVKFTNILAKNSEEDIAASDISTTITVGTVTGNEANATGNATNANGISIKVNNNTSNTNKGNAVKNTNTKAYENTSNVSEDDIPHTGAEDTIMYIVGALIIVSIVFYIKFEKINKEMK